MTFKRFPERRWKARLGVDDEKTLVMYYDSSSFDLEYPSICCAQLPERA